MLALPVVQLYSLHIYSGFYSIQVYRVIYRVPKVVMARTVMLCIDLFFQHMHCSFIIEETLAFFVYAHSHEKD